MNDLISPQLQRLEQKEEQYIALSVKADVCILDAFAVMRDIRNERLYQERGYTAFSDYAKKEWKISEAHAHRMISAVDLREKLADYGYSKFFVSERSLREFAGVPDDKLEAVASEAVSEVGDGQATSTTVKAAKKRVLIGTKKNTHPAGESKGKTLDVSADKIAQSVKICEESLKRLLKHLGVLGLADDFSTPLKKIEKRLPR